MKPSQILTVEDFELYRRDEMWLAVGESICRAHGIRFKKLIRSEHGENIVFLVDDSLVIKIFTPFKNGFRREKAAFLFVQNKTSLPAPEILFEGEIENFEYFIITQQKGVLMTREMWLDLEKREQIDILSKLADGLKELHSHNPPAIDFDWQKFIEHQTATVFERQRAGGANPEWLEKLPRYLKENLPLLPQNFAPAFVHGDVHFGNLRLVKTGGKWQISGLFDFADSLKGFHEYEFVAVGVLMMQGQGDLQREFFRAYGYRENEIDVSLRRRLMLLTILYECSSLRRYALRLRPEAVNYTLDELEKAIWNFA